MPSTLTSDRLILRPAVMADANWITKTIQTPDIYRNVARIPAAQTLADTEAFLRRVQGGEETETDIARLIEVDGASAGFIGLHRTNRSDPFNLGYWLHPDFWSQGVMTETASLMVDWADRKLFPKVLVSGYFHDNPSSGAILRKLGFLPSWRGPVFCEGRQEKTDHLYMTRLSV